jgi:hypothetical protein
MNIILVAYEHFITITFRAHVPLLQLDARVRFPRLSKHRRSMPTKLNNDMLAAAIEGFEVQKKRIDAQIAELRQLMTGGNAEPAATPAPEGKRRKVSAAGRKRMAEAQRKRWAAKKQSGAASQAAKPAPSKAKRRISEEGMKRIIAATKKRWAAVRAAAAKTGK